MIDKLFKIAQSFKDKLIYQSDYEKAIVAKKKLKEKLRKQEYITGIGIGTNYDGTYNVKLNIDHNYFNNSNDLEKVLLSIPLNIDNIRVSVDYVSDIVALGSKGEYGGKGKFELPDNHKAAMQVTKGGSSCKNCKFVDEENHGCKNEYYIQWNGGSGKLPDLPLDEICSDWWQK